MKKLYEKVQSNAQSAIDFCKSNQVDLLNVFRDFNAFENKQFKKYIEKVGIENYLNNVEFKTEIQIDNAF